MAKIAKGLFRHSIKISILMITLVMTLTALLSIGKYSMISLPAGVIKKVEFYTDKDLLEIETTGQLKRHDDTIVPTYPKVFVANIKKNYHCVFLTSERVYVNVFVSYWYGAWLYLVSALLLFIVSLWLLIRLYIKETSS